jgi:hypothetical protein
MVQEVILSSDYENTLIEIGKQYQLNVEQLGVLEQETTMTMMGLIPLKDFEAELTRELNIDKEKGAKIVAEIDEKVFLKIRDLLKLMNTPAGEEPNLDEETEKMPPPLAFGQNAPGEEIKTADAEEEKNTQAFSAHGIEIIPEKLELANKEKINSILTRKLTGSVQTPSVKTEHSLPNLSTGSAQQIKSPAPVMPASALGSIKPPSMETTKLSPSYSLGNDPYRLPPE